MPPSRSDRPLFTDEDRLRLLQLQTLRAIAERRERAAAQSAGEVAKGDQRAQTIPDRWRLVPEDTQLYDWQQECLERWLPLGRGTVKVATGGGKTLFALAAAERLQQERESDLRLVIVVPTIPLMFQWRDELLQGNLPASAIGLMGGGQEPPPLSAVRVLICVINAARAKLPALVGSAGWADQMLLVVDECHRANASRARRIFESHPKYTLGLSATPEQEGEDETVPTDEAYANSPVGQGLGPIIYEFTLKQSLDAGLLTPFEVWHIGLPLMPDEASQHARLSREIADLRKGLQVRHRGSRSRLGFIPWCQAQASRGGPAAADAARFIGLANRRKRLLYRAETRMGSTVALLQESGTDPDGRAIVFHESIAEIEDLFVAALDASVPAVLEHSQLPGSLRDESIDGFRRGIARAIISAKALVEGFNVPSADLGIIAASNASVRQRIQSLGRMLRRKPGGRTARIVVLYVRDTEDEAIYEKADWENVIGAERNRYFRWDPPDDDADWQAGLKEVEIPPRPYRSPSSEYDVSSLKPGDVYRAQTHGTDLKLDQDDNLRTLDGQLVRVPRALIREIAARSPYRRARITPAGHLIVRVDPEGSSEEDWRFLGIVALPEAAGESSAIRLRLKTSRGVRVIAREGERGALHFALGPDTGGSEEAGAARDALLSWIRTVEQERSIQITSLFWDGNNTYWLEVEGERVEHPTPLPPLEFKS